MISDYPARSRISSVAPELAARANPLFTSAELSTIIESAHTKGVKVAAHAVHGSTIKQISDLGVNSIEHGTFMDEGALS